MIVDQTDDDAIKQQAVKEGMRTLYKSAVDGVLDGTTTLEELKRFIKMD